MKIREFEKSRFLDYCNRADEFFKAMNDEIILERYNASALLGIHASIAIADSITIYESGKRSADEQHLEAVKFLKSICNTKGISEDGSNRLGKILSEKNFVAYGEHFRPMDDTKLQSIRLNVERFFSWAYKNFDYLRRISTEG
ncbi:MAG: hypothetical protein ABIF11_05170 [Nitrospirota bacterium]